ncbi:MAG: hypothetical protein ACOY9Y_07540 [Bacillota bacterium]
MTPAGPELVHGSGTEPQGAELGLAARPARIAPEGAAWPSVATVGAVERGARAEARDPKAGRPAGRLPGGSSYPVRLQAHFERGIVPDAEPP